MNTFWRHCGCLLWFCTSWLHDPYVYNQVYRKKRRKRWKEEGQLLRSQDAQSTSRTSGRLGAWRHSVGVQFRVGSVLQELNEVDRRPVLRLKAFTVALNSGSEDIPVNLISHHAYTDEIRRFQHDRRHHGFWWCKRGEGERRRYKSTAEIPVLSTRFPRPVCGWAAVFHWSHRQTDPGPQRKHPTALVHWLCRVSRGVQFPFFQHSRL